MKNMGLLDIFGKRGTPSMPAIDQVMDMKQRGMPDQIIVQNLQGQGVHPSEIQDAMMQADIKMRVGGPPYPSVSAPPQLLPQASMPPQGMEYQGATAAGMMAPPPFAQQMMMGPPQMGPPPQQMMMGPPMQGPMMGPPPQTMMAPQQMMMAPPQEMAPQMGPLPPGMTGQYPSPMQQFGVSTEDLVEKIVSEKMENLEKRLSEQEKIHSDLMQQIQQVRSLLNDMKGRYVQLQEDSVVKIEEYNKELESVGSQIKAMQRVMQNIIPTFAENVRSLTEVVKELRGGKGEQQVQQQQQSSRQATVMAPTKRVTAQAEELEESAAMGEPWQARVRKIGNPQGAEENAGFESGLM